MDLKITLLFLVWHIPRTHGMPSMSQLGHPSGSVSLLHAHAHGHDNTARQDIYGVDPEHSRDQLEIGHESQGEGRHSSEPLEIGQGRQEDEGEGGTELIGSVNQGHQQYHQGQRHSQEDLGVSSGDHRNRRPMFLAEGSGSGSGSRHVTSSESTDLQEERIKKRSDDYTEPQEGQSGTHAASGDDTGPRHASGVVYSLLGAHRAHHGQEEDPDGSGRSAIQESGREQETETQGAEPTTGSGQRMHGGSVRRTSLVRPVFQGEIVDTTSRRWTRAMPASSSSPSALISRNQGTATVPYPFNHHSTINQLEHTSERTLTQSIIPTRELPGSPDQRIQGSGPLSNNSTSNNHMTGGRTTNVNISELSFRTDGEGGGEGGSGFLSGVSEIKAGEVAPGDGIGLPLMPYMQTPAPTRLAITDGGMSAGGRPSVLPIVGRVTATAGHRVPRSDPGASPSTASSQSHATSSTQQQVGAIAHTDANPVQPPAVDSSTTIAMVVAPAQGQALDVNTLMPSVFGSSVSASPGLRTSNAPPTVAIDNPALPQTAAVDRPVLPVTNMAFSFSSSSSSSTVTSSTPTETRVRRVSSVLPAITGQPARREPTADSTQTSEPTMDSRASTGFSSIAVLNQTSTPARHPENSFGSTRSDTRRVSRSVTDSSTNGQDADALASDPDGRPIITSAVRSAVMHSSQSVFSASTVSLTTKLASTVPTSPDSFSSSHSAQVGAGSASTTTVKAATSKSTEGVTPGGSHRNDHATNNTNGINAATVSATLMTTLLPSSSDGLVEESTTVNVSMSPTSFSPTSTSQSPSSSAPTVPRMVASNSEPSLLDHSELGSGHIELFQSTYQTTNSTTLSSWPPSSRAAENAMSGMPSAQTVASAQNDQHPHMHDSKKDSNNHGHATPTTSTSRPRTTNTTSTSRTTTFSGHFPVYSHPTRGHDRINSTSNETDPRTNSTDRDNAQDNRTNTRSNHQSHNPQSSRSTGSPTIATNNPRTSSTSSTTVRKITSSTTSQQILVTTSTAGGPGDASPRTGTQPVSEDRVPVYIELKLQMTWNEFCDQEVVFCQELVDIVREDGQVESFTADQIRILETPRKICSVLQTQDQHGVMEEEEIDVQLYLVNKSHHYDVLLTRVCANVIKQGFNIRETSLFKNKLIRVEVHEVLEQTDNDPIADPAREGGSQNDNDDNNDDNDFINEPGVTIVLAIAAVGGVCCAALIIVQVVLRRRYREGMRSFTFNRSFSVTSVDSIALDSVIKSRPTSGHFNPALDLAPEQLRRETRHPMNFTELAAFAMNLEGIYEEFQMIPNKTPRLSVVPCGAEDKNRYANILPIPSTRVRLEGGNGDNDEVATFINANYVSGYRGQANTYIATQAPLESTMGDFWAMVWQHHSPAIVMLINPVEDGHIKCPSYFPDSQGPDCAVVCGDYSVVMTKRDVHQEYITSWLQIKYLKTGEVRCVRHFWLTCWALCGRPEPISLVRFVLDTRPQYEDSGTSVVVHCSNGTSRTGTFIALDVSMRQCEDRRSVDVMRCVAAMRQERAACIQTSEQYAILYQALNEYATILSSPGVSAASSATTLHAMLP